jgi:ferredoxin-NADP reductase
MDIRKVVFIAGGVGINPIMSMLEYLHLEGELRPGGVREVRILYGTKARVGEEILFYRRIGGIMGHHLAEGESDGVAADCGSYRLTMYLTGDTLWSPEEADGSDGIDTDNMEHKYRRMSPEDLLEALGPVAGRTRTVAYICGPPRMTDDFVELLSRAEGMEARRVLCEKWW